MPAKEFIIGEKNKMRNIKVKKLKEKLFILIKILFILILALIFDGGTS